MAKFPDPDILFVPKEVEPNWSQAEARPMMEQWELATLQLPGAKPTAAIAISNGTLTPAQAHHRVDTEGQAVADELDTIAVSDVHDGCVLYLYGADAGRIVTVRHNPNQVNGISLAGGADKALSTSAFMRLKREGDYWHELADGSVAASFSDALDGTRTAVDGVGASEWALAQVNTKAETAQTTADTVLRPGSFKWSMFAADEMSGHEPGWYFCNGDRYLVSSPQGAALNALPEAYRTRWGISVDASNAINLPNLFHSDGRGLFIRAVDGVTQQPGSVANDTMRPITGYVPLGSSSYGFIQVSGTNGAFTSHGSGYGAGRLTAIAATTGYLGIDSARLGAAYAGAETSPVSCGMTPAIYLGV